MKQLFPIFSFVLLTLIGAGCVPQTPTLDAGIDLVASGSQRVRAVQDIEFTTLDGQPVTLAEELGTPLVVNSWASWCTFCREELPDFAELQDRYGQEVTFIAINRAESAQLVRDYLRDEGVLGQLAFWQDEADAFYPAIDGFGMPNTLFITASGTLHLHKRGYMPRAEIERHVADMLGSAESVE